MSYPVWTHWMSCLHSTQTGYTNSADPRDQEYTVVDLCPVCRGASQQTQTQDLSQTAHQSHLQQLQSGLGQDTMFQGRGRGYQFQRGRSAAVVTGSTEAATDPNISGTDYLQSLRQGVQRRSHQWRRDQYGTDARGNIATGWDIERLGTTADQSRRAAAERRAAYEADRQAQRDEDRQRAADIAAARERARQTRPARREQARQAAERRRREYQETQNVEDARRRYGPYALPPDLNPYGEDELYDPFYTNPDGLSRYFDDDDGGWGGYW